MQNIPPTSTPSTSRRAGSSAAARHRVRPRAAALTLLAAVALALLVWGAAVPLGGLRLELASSDRTVGPVSIVGAVLVGGAAAWLLLAVLGSRPTGRRRWTVLAIMVLVLSLTGPVLSGAGGGVLAALELMHLVVGSTLILGLRRSTVPRAVTGRTVTAEAS